jgi:hypothetical protein
MVNLKHFEADKVSLATEKTKLKKGFDTLFVKYDGNDLTFQTPWMKMPFDPDDHENGRRAFSLNCPSGDFKTTMKSLDDKIVELLKARSAEVFNRTAISDEFLDINHSPIIRNGKEYSDKIKFKSDKKTLFFENKKVIDDPDVCRGDEVRAIIKVNYVWINKNKFGMTLMAKQFEYRKTDDEECSLSD